jgi:hypothetical protein
VRRILLWLLISACVWEGFVYLYSRPRFWEGLARVSERVGTGALHIYDMAKVDQERRAAQWEEFNHAHRARAGRAGARPHTGDTITDIEEFLRRKRSP